MTKLEHEEGPDAQHSTENALDPEGQWHTIEKEFKQGKDLRNFITSLES